MIDDYVTKFIDIPNKIANLEQSIKDVRSRVYGNNLFAHISYDDGYTHATSFNIEDGVIKMIEVEKTIQERIKRLKIRQSAFTCTLTMEEYKSLPDSKKELLNRDARQAEIYTAYLCGYQPPEEELELTNSIDGDIAMLADYFEEIG